MNFEIVYQNIPFLLKAAWVTVYLSLISFVIAVVIAFITGTFRATYKSYLNIAIGWYIEIFRGTPLLVQLFFIYYGLPQIGVVLSSTEAAIIGLSLNFGAYMSEIVRSGILAIDKGQYEAAKSLGMNKLKTLLYIIYPQSIRIMLPPLMNAFASILKDSSLVSVLSITELTRAGQLIYVRTYEPFEIYLTLAIFYFIMTYSVSIVSRKVEKSLLKGF